MYVYMRCTVVLPFTLIKTRKVLCAKECMRELHINGFINAYSHIMYTLRVYAHIHTTNTDTHTHGHTRAHTHTHTHSLTHSPPIQTY